VSRRTIQLDSATTVLFSPDDPVALMDRWQALVKVRVTDEMTGRAPRNAVSLEVKEPRMIPRIAGDGIGGVVGLPRQTFPAITAQKYFVNLTINSENYVSRQEEVEVPQLPPLTDFTAPELNVELHRQPTYIVGRTIRFVGNTSTPVGGATVSVAGIWRTAPPANVGVAPDPPNLVSLQPPLYSDRKALTQTLQRRNLLPVPGGGKRLLADTLPGTDQIRISDCVGFSNGDILLIDDAQPDLSELIAIKTVPVTSPADQPTLITLDYPLTHSHRRDATVVLLMPQPSGPPQQIIVDAALGDSCVFLDGLVGLVGADEIQIVGSPGPDEYHNVMNFTVVSDPNGYFRLPPLSRVAQLEIHAEKTIGVQLFQTTVTFRPDYEQRENRLDLALAP